MRTLLFYISYLRTNGQKIKTNTLLGGLKSELDIAILPTYAYICRMKKRILFVCLGNICRSPAADGIMQDLVRRASLEDKIEVDSAGTYSGHRGELPDARMRRAASLRGYNLTHRSRTVQQEDFEEFDYIVAMDDNNYENLHRLAPSREAANRICRMVEFTRHRFPDWHYVPDPYYEGREGFELVLDLLEEGCARLLEKVTDELKLYSSLYGRNS